MSDSPLDDICDELGIGQRVPGPMGSVGGKPRSNILIDMAKPGSDHTGHLVVLSHHPGELRFSKVQPLDWTETTGTVSDIPPPSGADLLAKMKKMIADMNKHAPRMDPAEKVVMGPVALAELRAKVPTAPGPDHADPLGIVSGIQIVESDVLDPDQWIAYDRKGRIVAMGRASSVGIFAMREPT